MVYTCLTSAFLRCARQTVVCVFRVQFPSVFLSSCSPRGFRLPPLSDTRTHSTTSGTFSCRLFFLFRHETFLAAFFAFSLCSLVERRQ